MNNKEMTFADKVDYSKRIINHVFDCFDDYKCESHLTTTGNFVITIRDKESLSCYFNGEYSVDFIYETDSIIKHIFRDISRELEKKGLK